MILKASKINYGFKGELNWNFVITEQLNYNELVKQNMTMTCLEFIII